MNIEFKELLIACKI